MKNVLILICKLWQHFNGETDYQRYLAHWYTHEHQADAQPLSRKAFFADETQRKWNGIKRCC